MIPLEIELTDEQSDEIQLHFGTHEEFLQAFKTSLLNVLSKGVLPPSTPHESN
jgi:hypothetical protein